VAAPRPLVMLFLQSGEGDEGDEEDDDEEDEEGPAAREDHLTLLEVRSAETAGGWSIWQLGSWGAT
jgi:hypothetical protein